MLFFVARRQYNRKMAANKDRRAFCVLDFHISRSVVTVQRNFRRKFGVQLPSVPSIRKWHANFKTRGCICKRKSTGCPPVSKANMEHVRESFTQSPQKSIVKASRELNIPNKLCGRFYGNLWSSIHTIYNRYRLWNQTTKPSDSLSVRRCCWEWKLLVSSNHWYLVTEPFSICQEKYTNTMSGYGLWKILTVMWNM